MFIRKKKFMHGNFDDLLQWNIIEPSRLCSPWASNILVVSVKKKQFHRSLYNLPKVEQCHNYKHDDYYPMPRIDDSLDQLRVVTWFSTLDLCSKYWHVAVDSQDKQKNSTHNWTRFVRILCNGNWLVQCSGNLWKVVGNSFALTEICLIYQNDTIVYE